MRQSIRRSRPSPGAETTDRQLVGKKPGDAVDDPAQFVGGYTIDRLPAAWPPSILVH